jgi:hypothetical protein
VAPAPPSGRASGGSLALTDDGLQLADGAEGSFTQRLTGDGLCLPIVRAIADTHDATITAPKAGWPSK